MNDDVPLMYANHNVQISNVNRKPIYLLDFSDDTINSFIIIDNLTSEINGLLSVRGFSITSKDKVSILKNKNKLQEFITKIDKDKVVEIKIPISRVYQITSLTFKAK